MTESMDDWGFELHALYRIYDPFGRPLYFGETDDLPRRLRQHMEKAWFRRPEITIKVAWFPNRAEALAAETAAIAAEKPWHNKSGLKAAPAVAKLPPTGERQPVASERRPSIAEEKHRLAEEGRRMAEEREHLRRDQPPRDLLADLCQVMTGDERIRLSALPHLLRQLAPGHVAYEPLTGVQLREELKRRGVRVYNTDNVPRLDPADLRVILKKAG